MAKRLSVTAWFVLALGVCASEVRAQITQAQAEAQVQSATNAYIIAEDDYNVARDYLWETEALYNDTVARKNAVWNQMTQLDKDSVTIALASVDLGPAEEYLDDAQDELELGYTHLGLAQSFLGAGAWDFAFEQANVSYSHTVASNGTSCIWHVAD